MLTTVGPTYFQYPPLAKRTRTHDTIRSGREKEERGKTGGSIGKVSGKWQGRRKQRLYNRKYSWQRIPRKICCHSWGWGSSLRGMERQLKERMGKGVQPDREVDKTMKHLGHVNRTEKETGPQLKDLTKRKGRTNIWTGKMKGKSSC